MIFNILINNNISIFYREFIEAITADLQVGEKRHLWRGSYGRTQMKWFLPYYYAVQELLNDTPEHELLALLLDDWKERMDQFTAGKELGPLPPWIERFECAALICGAFPLECSLETLFATNEQFKGWATLISDSKDISESRMNYIIERIGMETTMKLKELAHEFEKETAAAAASDMFPS